MVKTTNLFLHGHLNASLSLLGYSYRLSHMVWSVCSFGGDFKLAKIAIPDIYYFVRAWK